MTVLVVYYSLSGTSRVVATALARELTADIEEIRCGRYSPGGWGSVLAGYDSWRGNLPPIAPLMHAPSRYSLVVLGGPVWAFHPATPVRAFLAREASRLPDVAFFLTHGGSASQRSLQAMERLAGRKPVATLVVREADVKAGKVASVAAPFVKILRKTFAEPELLDTEPARKEALVS